MSTVTLPALIQRFFTDRLCIQMEASRHTVAGYRDTFRLLLRYASARHGKPPVKLTVEDIDADLVADFLVHTEAARGNSTRSRNTRLAAIRSFFRYVAMSEPVWLLQCQRILAMPNKRYVKRAVTFLEGDEIAALLAAPDRTTWAGRRDHALLLLAVQTGLRTSELVSLTRGDVVLGSGAHIRCMGKGRKERATPLRRETAKLLAAWIGEDKGESKPLFPSIRGDRLSRDALEHLVRKHCLTASRACPSIGTKRVTPHTLRHYLPFLTMSCNVSASAGTTGTCWSRRVASRSITRHSLLVLQTIEEIQELVTGLISARSAVQRCRFRERLFLHGERCVEIYLGSFDALMSEPQRDHGAFHA